MRTSVQSTLLAVAVLVGAACPGPDDLNVSNNFLVTARGANVLPAITGTAIADTLAAATATITANDADSTISWTYSIGNTAGSGAVDSVGIVLGGGATAVNVAAITYQGGPWCNSTTTCTATGTGKTAKIATYPALLTALRGYGVQLLVITTGRPKLPNLTAVPPILGGGAIRGTAYIVP